MGDCAFHCRRRNQHVDHHQHSRPGLRHESDIHAGCDGLRPRARNHQLCFASPLFSRRSVHGVRTHRAAVRTRLALADGWAFSNYTRSSGRSACVRGLHCGDDRTGHRGNRLHRDHHRADFDLHLRRRPSCRDLDGRSSNRDLHWRNAGGVIHHPAPRARWVACHSLSGRDGRKAASIRFRT